jgi:hypothetical protein
LFSNEKQTSSSPLRPGFAICKVSVTSSHKAHALELVPDFMSEVTSEGRTHVLLLGDKPSDCCPLQGLPKSTPALKIGFLAEPTEEKFQEYLTGFDAVLVSDATMDFVNCLLDSLSSTSMM